MIKFNDKFIKYETNHIIESMKHKEEDEDTSINYNAKTSKDAEFLSVKDSVVYDKTMKALELFQNKNRTCDLFDEIIDKFTAIIECQKVTIFIINEDLQKN